MRLPRATVAIVTGVTLLAACDGGLPTVAATESTECVVTTSFDGASVATPLEAFERVRDTLAETAPGVDDDILDAIAEQITQAGEGTTPIVAGADGVTVRLVPDGDPPKGWLVSEAKIPTAC